MEGIGNTGVIARRIFLVFILGTTFVASAMLTIYVLFQSGEVRVPNIVGMSQQEAERAVERAGLNVRLRRQHFDPEVPQGVVSEQEPSAGFPVKVGYDIKIDISKGPDPTGQSEEPPPPGPTNPVDPPKEPKPEKKKKPEEDPAKMEAADGKKEGVDPKAKTDKADDPSKAKPGDPPKPDPKADGPKPAPAPKTGDPTSDPPTTRPRTAAPKPPPT